MSKKFFALVLISVMLLAGGCGGSSNSQITSITDVNAALKGAWTSSNNGTATIADNSETAGLQIFIDEFGEDVINSICEENGIARYNKISAPVTRAMVLFEECNIAETSGTAKMTAIVIVKDNTSFLPIVFNNVTLSTQRNGTDEWTATVPDVGTLSISMTAEEKMTLSGTVKYLGYDCEFSTVINKNQPNSIDLGTILNGTWSLDGTQGGGYLAAGSQIIAAAYPETVSIFFSGTEGNSQPSIKSFYSLRMNTSVNESYEKTSLLQNISEGSGILSNICDDVYRFRATDGSESIIFVENVDEISVFMLESEDSYGQACMFLPLKKVDIDIEDALKKTWTASKGMGGGYASDFRGNGTAIQLLNALGAFSFSLENAELKFADTNLNDDGTVTASVDMHSSFLLTNEILAGLPGISEEDMLISMSDNGRQVTMTRSGNFLQFSLDGDVYKLSFISDKEAFLAITPDQALVGKGEFAIRMRTSE